MAFAWETDELKQEVRQNVADTIRFWPKVDGSNVQVESSGCTFEVFDPSGTSIQGPTAIDGTLVGDIDRFDISVNAIASLDEDYYVDVLWLAAGESLVRRDVVYFDCVLYPWGSPSVSLNDLLEERPDVGDILDRLGQRLGYTAGDVAKEAAAGIYAVRARVDLDTLIRAQINAQAVSHERGSYPGSWGLIINRPHLILNRHRLNRVERKLAMKLVYEANCDHEEAEWWDKKAQAAWAAVGPLKFDSAQNLVPDQLQDDIGRAVNQRRVQS